MAKFLKEELEEIEDIKAEFKKGDIDSKVIFELIFPASEIFIKTKRPCKGGQRTPQKGL